MVQAVNLYITGPLLHPAQRFFGRQGTLEWIIRGLRNPAVNSVVLFGQRRIGKTALLLQIQRTLSPDLFLPIYFDPQEHTTRPLGNVLADLSDVVSEALGVTIVEPGTFDDRGLFFGRTFLPQVYALIGKHRRLVFLFDEFEVLSSKEEDELPPSVAYHAFLRFIRRLMNTDNRPAFVFTAGRRVDDLALDFTARFKAAMVREVWTLERPATEMLIRQAEANGTLRFTDRAVERIIQLAGGHPYFTMLLCQQVWEQAYAHTAPDSAPPQVTENEVEAALTATLAAGDAAMAWIWDGTSLAEKIYAAALAETVAEGEFVPEEHGFDVLDSHAARLRIRGINLAPRDLVRRRVLELPEEGFYGFAIDLFRRWIRQNHPLDEVKEELDRIDPLADELFGIGQEFLRREQLEPATRYFRDALQANPQHFHARLSLGEALLRVGQVDEAVGQLEQAYRMDQAEARSALRRALLAQVQARQEVRDEDGALATCERILQIAPEDETAQAARRAILIRRWQEEVRAAEQERQWEEAARLYEKLVTLAPDHERMERWQAKLERCRREQTLARLFREGEAALRQRRWQQAQQALSEVVYGQPDYRLDGRLAARLLLQAVRRQPVGRNRVIGSIILALLIVLVGVGGYVRFWRDRPVNPPVPLPAGWQLVDTVRLDSNRDSRPDWVVLYRFDPLPEARSGTPSREPISGIVYQTGSQTNALESFPLRPQDGDYLCECACAVTMEEALSGLPGKELIIRDYCNGEVTRLSIFYWDALQETYASQGHFAGSRIIFDMDQVTVLQRLPHRAQLAFQQVYQPRDDQTYYQLSSQGILVLPKYEWTFYYAEPADVTVSPYPEKVVLAFYNHYTDGKASAYVTKDGWQAIGQCLTGQCGCRSFPQDIAHVRVTDLQVMEEGSNEAIVSADVVCERQNGTEEPSRTVRWHLTRQEGRWLLHGVEMGGD